MKKNGCAVLACILVICCLVTGCAKENAPEFTLTPFDSSFSDAVRCYSMFIDAAMADWSDAVEKYCHFESADNRKLSLEKGTPTRSCEILRVEKLSDQLWEFEVFIKDGLLVDGAYGVHYVGVINGEYRVMVNIEEIPAALKDGVEIVPYKPHGPSIIGTNEDMTGTIS